MPRIALLHLTPLLPVPALAACITLAPPASGATTGATDTSGETTDTSLPWPAPPTIDRTGIGSASTTASTTSTPATSTTATTSTTGVLPSLDGLRITEFLADPPGKDGGAASPEFLEITNFAPEPAPLDDLVVRARSWPRLDAADLGLVGHSLAPGGRLLLLRHASGEGPAPPLVEAVDDRLSVAFTTTEGLRNADGAAMLVGPGDAILDAVVYGLPAPSPYDDPLAWQGPPASAAGAGHSLCRLPAESDTDRAEDWQECDPTPGELPDPPADPGDTSSTGTTGGTDTTGIDTDNPPGLPAIAIVEVLSNAPGPGNGEKALEYVEILNIGDDPIDLAGFTVADALGDMPPGVDPLLPVAGEGGCQPATCLAPGHRALIVGNAYQGPIGSALVLATDDSTIADGGLSALEPVLLRDPDGEVVSTYRVWPDPMSEPYPINMEEPLHRASPTAPDEPASWSYGPSTPGA